MPSRHWNLEISRTVLILITLTTGTARTAEIKGIAYDGDTRQGQPGVVVTLSASGRSRVTPQTRFTASNGAYLFDNLAAGKYRLEFSKVGYTIVVPYREPIELVSNTATSESVRVYSNAGEMSAEKITRFLAQRSHGSPELYRADITALKSTAFNVKMRAVIARAERGIPILDHETLPAKTDGMIATITPASGIFTIKKTQNSMPTKYSYSKSTTIVDSNGRKLSITALRPETSATIHHDKESTVANKIVLYESPEARERRETMSTTTSTSSTQSAVTTKKATTTTKKSSTKKKSSETEEATRPPGGEY